MILHELKLNLSLLHTHKQTHTSLSIWHYLHFRNVIIVWNSRLNSISLRPKRKTYICVSPEPDEAFLWQCVFACVFYTSLWNVKSLPSQESLLRRDGNDPTCHLHFEYHPLPLWLPFLCQFQFPFLALSSFLCSSFFFLFAFTPTHWLTERDFPVYYLIGNK